MKWLLFCILLIPFASAIGIAPAKKIFDIEAGKEETILYRIYNTEKKEFTAKISVNGSLSDNIILETNEIIFTKNDSYKTFMVTVSHPETTSRGDIMIDEFVSAVIEMQGSAPLPTGNVITKPEITKNNYWIHGILIFVIIGNIAYYVVGSTKIKSSGDLLRKLKKAKRTTFDKHVTSNKNDYADWLREIGEPELAYKIYDIKNKESMILAIEEHMKSPEPTKDPEELKVEIHELKRELESFDFKEFERNSQSKNNYQ